MNNGNDEARMSNDEGNDRQQMSNVALAARRTAVVAPGADAYGFNLSHSGFVIDSSFVIRHFGTFT
jgi:hypothetical protein